ncbi:M48 family metallopeptidase [Sporosarcina sp. CAU 1771]
MKVNYEKETIEFIVQYGNAKKLSIHIDGFGFVTLKAPKNTSEEVIKNAIISHGKAIVEKLNEIKTAQAIYDAKEYYSEGVFPYLGKEYPLSELIETDNLDEETLKSNLKKFYFARCKIIIEERVKIYQAQLKVKPKVIEIVESKGKWGTCNTNKKVTFNYRLAMAPIEVIDYVVIHELCHLLHMNHDRSFWRRLGSIMPDYKEKEKYLERYGPSMTL